MAFAVAHQQKAGVVGDLAPFVEIERNRIRTFDAGKPWRQLRRENAERTEGAIDVKPDLLLATQCSDRAEIIDRADVDGAGGSDHQKRLQPDRAITRNLPAQRIEVDAM